ncbi:protein S100-A16-like isoform X1 [Lissotriton helveticus]
MASNDVDPEFCIGVLVKTFYQYAGKKRMNRKEFQKMVSTELNHILSSTEDKEEVNELIRLIDANEDGKISFEEYWSLISLITDTLSKQMAMHSEVKPSNAQVDQMTDVERSINTIVRYFYEHSTVQGDPKTVSTEELKTMLQADFLNCIKAYSDPGQVLKGLDSKSQDIEFSEYWKIIERFANDLKKQEKKKR